MTMTKEQIAAMISNELRIEIARRLGWKSFSALQSGRLLGTSPNGRFSDTVPDWPIDISAALSLLEQTGWEYFINKVYEPFTGEVIYEAIVGIDTVDENGNQASPEYRTEGSTLCIAISRCWLLWKDAQP